MMNTVKNTQTIKKNLGEILYSLQHLNVDGRDLAKDIKVNDMIQMSKQDDAETESNINQILNLSTVIVEMTSSIKTPRNSGISGAIYQADQNKNQQ